MATSPVIETARLTIEPFDPDRHLTERNVRWLNDPVIVRFSEQRRRVHTLESCRSYAATFAGTPHHYWALVVKGSTEGPFGTLNAYVNEAQSTADLGILVGESAAQGRGLATEAWLGVCDFLFRSRGLRKLTAGALAANAPMLRLMDRAGMVPDGRRIRQMLWEGQEVDILHAALFREDWLARFPTSPRTEL